MTGQTRRTFFFCQMTIIYQFLIRTSKEVKLSPSYMQTILFLIVNFVTFYMPLTLPLVLIIAHRALAHTLPACLFAYKKRKSLRNHLLFGTEEFCKRKACSKMKDRWLARPDECSISVLNDYHTSISNHNFKRGKHEVSAAIPREFLQQFHHHKAIAQSSLYLFLSLEQNFHLKKFFCEAFSSYFHFSSFSFSLNFLLN